MASMWHVNKLLEMRIKEQGICPPRTVLLSTQNGKPRFVTDLSWTRPLPVLWDKQPADFLGQRMAVVR